MNYKKFLFLFISMMQCFAYALDQTNRYMGYRLASMPKRNKAEWGSSFFLTSGWSEAKSAYDSHGLKAPLFNDLGAQRVKELGPDLTGVTDPMPDPATLTEREKMAWAVRELELSTDEASLSICGKYRQIDLVLQAIQNFKSGLFVHVVLPFKSQKITGITINPLLKEDDYKAGTAVANTRESKYKKFLELVNDEVDMNTYKASLTRLLYEADIENLTQDFNVGGLGDLSVYLGWGGEQVFDHAITKYVEGTVRFGVVAPVGRTSKIDQPFTLPFGSEHHWAITGYGEGEFGFLGYCAVGASLGSTIFFPKKYEVRLPIREDQQGWIRLDKGKVRVDRGSMWEATGYFKVMYEPYGLSAWSGISYYAQGITSFTRPENSELFTSQVLLADQRTRNWQHWLLNFGFMFDARQVSTKRVLPSLMITYNHSLAGQQVWKTNLFGGSFGLYCQWDW